jgi:hypothetical protein
MTRQEAELMFFRELKAVIATARANGVDGGVIAHDLRSIASDVSRVWKAELDRLNAQHIERQSN